MAQVEGEGLMDFDEIADQQGWNAHTCLQLCREFISKVGMQEALDVFAQEKADEENVDAEYDPHVYLKKKE